MSGNSLERTFMRQADAIVSQMLERLEQGKPEQRPNLEPMQRVCMSAKANKTLELYAMRQDQAWATNMTRVLEPDRQPTTKGWYYDDQGQEIMWEAYDLSNDSCFILLATRPRRG